MISEQPQMTPVHGLRVAIRMLREQRRREMMRFERGIGAQAQANALGRIADIDEVVETLMRLEADLSEGRQSA